MFLEFILFYFIFYNSYNISKSTVKIPGVNCKENVYKIPAKITLQPGKDSLS